MAKRSKPTRPLPNPRTAQQPPALSGADLAKMLTGRSLLLNALPPVVRPPQRNNKRGRR
jgi:hypothetical protein